MSKAINARLGAMIFYNETLDDCVYSIYVKKAGFSFGYFFRSSGAYAGDMDVIHEFVYDSSGSAIISMNQSKVAEITLDNGISVTRIDIDPAKPFAVVLPANCGSVTLYDTNGDVVEITTVAREA